MFFCLFDGDKHRVYYECLDSTKVLAIRMDELRRWMQQQPQFYPMFLQYAAKMMRKLEKTASELIFTDLSTRLLQLILSNINERNHQLELIDNLPNKELASMVGSTRAVVNRYLQTLKKKRRHPDHPEPDQNYEYGFVVEGIKDTLGQFLKLRYLLPE